MMDIKNLNVKELAVSCANIREFLINEVSQTGGHLASNLGVVELTVAMHKVFNLPDDKIIWDVGHQAYIHKILTGRAPQFSTLRQLDGLSGFPKSFESEYDAFDTGHSSTAISAALGMCAARDTLGQSHHVIAVVGDGSMTGGLVYEALNNAGRTNTDLLVILNDNQMSIAKNVGALSRHLNDLRTAPAYHSAKRDVHKLLKKTPRIDKLVENAKDTIKFMLVKGILFEEMGFSYFGPVDGHDLKKLTSTLQKIKSIKGPVLLHVITKKGKGYHHAEKSPGLFHGIEPFDIETGKLKNASTQSADTYTDVFGKTVLKIAEEEEKLCAISAAMPDGTGLCEFQKKYPKRFYDVGIAESHAVTFAAGMAKGGLIPVVAVYSSFFQRAYDQILHDVCIQNLHVVLAVDRAGIVGADGETHQGIFDLSYLAHMPNMTILAPKNGDEMIEMLYYAVLQHKGPIAVRYPKGSAANLFENCKNPIEYGKSETIFKGEDIAIISVGAMMEHAHTATEILRTQGYNPSLYNARFVKPITLDEEKLKQDLRNYQHIFILEDNIQTGGYGERLQALFNGNDKSIKAKFHLFAFPDKFIEQGTREELFDRYNLNGKGIASQILSKLK